MNKFKTEILKQCCDQYYFGEVVEASCKLVEVSTQV